MANTIDFATQALALKMRSVKPGERMDLLDLHAESYICCKIFPIQRTNTAYSTNEVSLKQSVKLVTQTGGLRSNGYGKEVINRTQNY
jgi:hypothetical protein